ncbi:hypothetical protein D0Z67_16610 [Streptomyces seoulensis]|uniref:Integral membrane protein n=1 Tax=Streptomyces seoulensis TaxID=73044 RepID=A0A4P6TYN3_STRSO|nr:hypothetical protein [Streptomyces seoulensis]QBJ91744.1 hypothetical protein D0Z67_16610 [Streptomyces seoulensis]
MADRDPDDDLARLRERVDALESRPAPVRHRTRSVCAAVLIVLGCLLAPLALVATWTADLADDTDRYVATVAPLARDSAVQDAAADRITDELMRYLNLSDLLKDAAPADRPGLEKALGALGGSLDDAVSGFVRKKAREVVASETFARFWTDANRRLHTTVDKALTGSGGGAVRIEGDAVTVDLAPVIEQVKTRLVDAGLKPAAKIPDVHTDFTVLRTEKVADLQTYFRLLQLAGVWLPVIAALLLAGGVLLAVRRRRALVAAALGFAVTALLLGLGLTVFRAFYLDALPASVSQPAAGAVYDTLTRFLRTAVRAVVALGVVLALAAWLSGPGRRASAVRQIWHAGIGAARTQTDRLGLRTGPVGPFVHRHRVWIGWLLVAGAVVAFVLWPHPTGWVVVGIALALLFALAVVDFVGEERAA